MGLTEDYLDALYKELYESELERSDKLDAQVNLPTAVITGLLAVSAFYIEHFPGFSLSLSVALFVLCMLFYGGFLVLAVLCLIRSYFNHKYELLPPPEQIDQNVAALRAHYQAEYSKDRDIDESIRSDIQLDIINVYKQSGSFNRQSNITRIAWLHWATRWIICSIITLVITNIVYYFGIPNSKPQEVKIAEMPKDIEVHRIEIIGRDIQ